MCHSVYKAYLICFRVWPGGLDMMTLDQTTTWPTRSLGRRVWQNHLHMRVWWSLINILLSLTKNPAQPDKGQHFFMELQRQVSKQSRACIVTRFVTIWNFRDFKTHTRSLKHTCWHYLKWFGTSETIVFCFFLAFDFCRFRVIRFFRPRHNDQWPPTFYPRLYPLRLFLFILILDNYRNKFSKACILTLFEAIWKWSEHIENKVAKDCLLTLFERYLNLLYRRGYNNPPGNFENKDGKWCILTAFETIWKCREKK